MSNNTAVVVLGMHRSGTSALAGTLNALGVQFGKTLLPPQADNPRGFWEQREIIDLNEHIFAVLGSSWDDVRPLPHSWWTEKRVAPFRAEMIRVLRQDFAAARIWGLKEPRICRLAPLWCDVFDELDCQVSFVLIHRHPLEVAHSLKRRNGFDMQKSGLLWLEHNLLAERWTRGRPRIFVSYDQVLGQPEATCARIFEMMERTAGSPIRHKLDAIRRFIDPNLRHHELDTDAGSAEFGESQSLIETTHNVLLTQCQEGASGEERILDRLYRDYQAVTSKFDPTLSAHIEDLALRIGELRDEIARITSSRSWKITEPLREAKRLVAGIGKDAISK